MAKLAQCAWHIQYTCIWNWRECNGVRLNFFWSDVECNLDIFLGGNVERTEPTITHFLITVLLHSSWKCWVYVTSVQVTHKPVWATQHTVMINIEFCSLLSTMRSFYLFLIALIVVLFEIIMFLLVFSFVFFFFFCNGLGAWVLETRFQDPLCREYRVSHTVTRYRIS